MARADNAYSRFVNWARILLPVAALGLLSSLFLFQGRDEDAASLPFSEVELEALARGQGIGGPHFTGVMEDGRALSLEADSAYPRLGDRRVVDAQRLRASLEHAVHREIRLAAAAAVLDQELDRADLTGGVLVETATGYRVVTEALRTALNRTDLESLAPVRVTGPSLEIAAGGMTLRADPAQGDAVILVFKDGVDLIYRPGSP